MNNITTIMMAIFAVHNQHSLYSQIWIKGAILFPTNHKLNTYVVECPSNRFHLSSLFSKV